MENASKALLIAASIIIVILIISFGMYIWQKAQSAANLDGMDQAKIEAFNSNLQKYEGKEQKGSEIVGLINTINALNQDEDAENNVAVTGSVIATATEADGKIASMQTKDIKRNSTYTVECTQGKRK